MRETQNNRLQKCILRNIQRIHCKSRENLTSALARNIFALCPTFARSKALFQPARSFWRWSPPIFGSKIRSEGGPRRIGAQRQRWTGHFVELINGMGSGKDPKVFTNAHYFIQWRWIFDGAQWPDLFFGVISTIGRKFTIVTGKPSV